MTNQEHIRLVRALEDAANIRVMATDTMEGMKRIDDDIEHNYKMVMAGLLTTKEAVQAIKRG